jgi:hypothetical protein
MTTGTEKVKINDLEGGEVVGPNVLKVWFEMAPFKFIVLKDGVLKDGAIPTPVELQVTVPPGKLPYTTPPEALVQVIKLCAEANVFIKNNNNTRLRIGRLNIIETVIKKSWLKQNIHCLP